MSLRYNADIDIKYGDLSKVIRWCDENCKDNWTFDVKLDAGQEAGTYGFKFESELDLFSFLVWKK